MENSLLFFRGILHLLHYLLLLLFYYLKLLCSPVQFFGHLNLPPRLHFLHNPVPIHHNSIFLNLSYKLPILILALFDLFLLLQIKHPQLFLFSNYNPLNITSILPCPFRNRYSVLNLLLNPDFSLLLPLAPLLVRVDLLLL